MKRKIAIALAAAGLLAGLAACAPAPAPVDGQVCTVQEKDRAISSKTGTSYRIYTDCGVLEIQDNIFLGQFNSADDYARLKVGQKYEFETVGVRAPLFSMFPQITAAEEVAN